MTVEMPPAYPEEPPMITLESIRGVTDDECVQLVATLQEMVGEDEGGSFDLYEIEQSRSLTQQNPRPQRI